MRGLIKTSRELWKTEYTFNQVLSLRYRLTPVSMQDRYAMTPKGRAINITIKRQTATVLCDDSLRGQWYFRPATDIAMGAAAGEPCGRVTPYEGESSLLPDRFPTDPGCWEQIWSRFITRHASSKIDETETKNKYGAWSYIIEGVFKGGTIP